MGRRDGTVDLRVRVAVSNEMVGLRRTQAMLNGFWQTSELAYGYLLSEFEREPAHRDRPTVEVLGHIQSEVWFPNNQGRIKHTDTIGQTLNQVRDNTIHVYRATLISFFSAFEAYLDSRVDSLRPPNVRWGEYVRSLSHASLRTAACALSLRTVLRADFCREIRNRMIHESFDAPTSVTDAHVLLWRARLSDRALAAGWPASEVQAAVNDACSQVIGQAVNHVEDGTRNGKSLPIELFYMLFTFTNLDSLAFAIEEALQPHASRPGGEISRKEKAVRRFDLVIGPELPPDTAMEPTAVN